MTKKFNRKRSLDEGEIVLEDAQDVERFLDLDQSYEAGELVYGSTEQEPAYVMEVEVSAEPASILDATSNDSEPTQTEIKFAKQFTGHPTPVDYASKQLAQSCTRKKLLAEFDTGSFARGSQWHIYCKR